MAAVVDIAEGYCRVHFRLVDSYGVGETCLQGLHNGPLLQVAVERDDGIEAGTDFFFLFFLHAGHELFPNAFLGWEGDHVAVVEVDTCFFCGKTEGQGEPAQCVDKTQRFSLESSPNTATGNAVDIFTGKTTAVGYTLSEGDIEIFDIALHHLAGSGGEWTVEGKTSAVAVGHNGIGGDSQFLAQEVADFGQGGKDTDATGRGGGVGDDLVPKQDIS